MTETPVFNVNGNSLPGPLIIGTFAWGDFHARSRFARSTISGGKWGTTRSLLIQLFSAKI